MNTDHRLQKWLDFYRPHVESEEDLRTFVTACADQVGPHASKIIMHQVRRLVLLADDTHQLRPGRDSLAVFWYVVCAEAVSKLQADKSDEGLSRQHVRRFFCELASPTDRDSLAGGFKHLEDLRPMTVSEAAGILYDVRCSVAHEGNYWEFTMAQGIDMINVAQPAIVSITLGELRDLVVRTGVTAAKSRLPA